MATVKEFVRKDPSEAPGPAHPCDDPSLSPKEFLLAIMRDRAMPLSTRIQAAHDVAPYVLAEPRPTTNITCTIVIEGIRSEDPDRDNRNQQSNLSDRSHNPRPFPGAPGPSHIEKIIERIPLSEIIEIVSRTPGHLLPICTICNHPMMYPCSVAPIPSPSHHDPSTLPCVTRHTGRTVH